MDYLVFSAVAHFTLLMFNFSYDIACQWHKKLWTHMSRMPERLQLNHDTKIVQFFIPKFHLRVHIQKCQTAFLFNFSCRVGRTCYGCLLREYFFSPMSILLSYVSFRTLPISGGPVCLLSWSPVFLSCALSSGHPYPCSSSAFRFLNGVGSSIDYHLVHRLFVIPVDSLCSPR